MVVEALGLGGVTANLPVDAASGRLCIQGMDRPRLRNHAES